MGKPNSQSKTIIVDEPLLNTTAGCDLINTSDLIKILLLDKEETQKFSEQFKLTFNQATSVLYMLISPDGTVSPVMEVGLSNRFMNGNVGPRIPFAHGCGVIVQQDKVDELLSDLLAIFKGNYTGELSVSMDEDGNLSGIGFAHHPHLMAMYSEFLRGGTEEAMDFLTGDGKIGGLREGIVCCNLVSKSPFPMITTGGPQIRSAGESEGERHLWRVPVGNSQIVFVTAHSDNFVECRRRVFRTIRRMQRFDDTLQFRTDFAYDLKFALVQSEYEAAQRKAKEAPAPKDSVS